MGSISGLGRILTPWVSEDPYATTTEPATTAAQVL